MIHYSCDLCKRLIDAEDDLRYVVKIEVYAALDPVEVDTNGDDRDHLQEMQDILQRMEEEGSDEVGEDVYQQLRFDLCPECRKKFVKNPLGREARQAIRLQQKLSRAYVGRLSRVVAQFSTAQESRPTAYKYQQPCGPYRALAICAAAVYVAARCWLGGADRPANLPEGRYRVAGVSGGDTIVLANQVRIRLLGIAPPRAVGGKLAPATPSPDRELAVAAAEFIRRSVSQGEVQLQFDRTRIDADGHLLGYVWFDDGERGRLLLNEELLREGLARASRMPHVRRP